MALLRRCLCWYLRTASFIGFCYVVITATSALLLRALDLAAFDQDDFEISRGFNTQWRSHQWQAFVASDVIVAVCHISIILFSLYMIYNVTQLHFVLYMKTMQVYNYCFIMYTFIEFCFSVFEFSFYGLNTFRREYLVFIWLWWLMRAAMNGIFVLVLFSRCQEMEEEMAYELRHSDKKYIHSYA
ncbi:uncharacterized protein LOC143299240 [Babylonia areolata]|uniref:uncharacterized protein LOC143299240 n=1 Tax=Babylonia areolata TaxID=304850 RepID=UPI003FD24C26